MKTIIFLLLAIFFGAVSAVSFIFNSSTPMQLGPIYVIGGAILCIRFFVTAIALHLVWK